MPQAVRTKKRRRTHARAVLAVLTVLVLVLGGTAGYFLLAPLVSVQQQTQAPAPTGPVRALVLDTDAAVWQDAAAQEQTLTDTLETVVKFAAGYGFNAVVVPVHTLSGIFYRDSEYDALPAIAAQDSFFHHYDALKTLCSLAAQQNLAVYAQLDAAAVEGADAAMLQHTVKKLNKYAIAGVLTQEQGAADAKVLQLQEDGTPASGDSLLRFYAADSAAALTLYKAAQTGAYAGCIFGLYEDVSADMPGYSMLASALNTDVPAVEPLVYSAPQALAVTYPKDGAYISTTQTYLMGTSDAAKSLTINGEPITTRDETSGLWGAHISLESGENTVTLQNGEETVTLTIKQGSGGSSSSSSSSGSSSSSSSGSATWTTQSIADGGIRVSTTISSVLSSATKDNSITATAQRGAQAQAVEVLKRNGKDYAYKLTTGDYVRAENTSWLAQAPSAKFTGAAALKDGRLETLTFAGSGAPLAYTDFDGTSLTLTFPETTLANDFAVDGSTLVSECAVTNADGSATLSLSFSEEILGYCLQYDDNTTRLLLKQMPQQSTVFGKPLTGVTVLLDAGHGGEDSGAMGVGGADAPLEKDVNLAVANAAKVRLEQMGATVVMTRSDDTAVSLSDRLKKIEEVQPDCFIAVHHNSTTLVSDSSEIVGEECYYFYYNRSENLAKALTINLGTQLDRVDRGAMGGYYYYVTRSTLCPAVLLECGFMPSPTEYTDITNADSILVAGNAIAQSVLDTVPTAQGSEFTPGTLVMGPGPVVPQDADAQSTVAVDAGNSLPAEMEAQLTDNGEVAHPLAG